MRLLVFGGSFNPVHLGHLHTAEDAARSLGYDRVAMIPSMISPLKLTQDDPGVDRRLEMLRAALDGDELLYAEACEAERGGTSYTIDTLNYLVRSLALTEKPGLLIGADLCAGFGKWRDAERIAELADIVVARRDNADTSMPFAHKLLDNSSISISSSDIRARIRRGRAFRYLVPSGAYRYIVSNGLYGA